MISRAVNKLLLRFKMRRNPGQIGDGVITRWSSDLRILGSKGRIDLEDGVSIGQHSEVFVWEGHVRIGADTSMNDNVKIYENVRIGSNCLFASNIFISSGTHVFRHRPELPIKVQDTLTTIDAPIAIDDDCWIGFGVVVMPGVSVGKGAILGANSVITTDVAPYSVVGGIPAKKIGARLEFQPPTMLDAKESSHWPYFYSGFDYRQFHAPVTGRGIRNRSRVVTVALAKSKAGKIRITGTSEGAARFEASVNENKWSGWSSDGGTFEAILAPIDSNAMNHPSRLPKMLTDHYWMLTIEAFSNDNSARFVSWTIATVGIE